MAASGLDEVKVLSASNGEATNATISNIISNTSGDTIEELTKEVELLKQKLEEERAKFNDVECNLYPVSKSSI